MRLTFYANACCSLEADGFRLLTDPWLVDGVFEGAWHHYPPLKTRPEDLAGVDALFISHLHPDHCDPETLKAFPRNIPILVLDHGPNFLHRVLKRMGFDRLVPVKDGETMQLGPFRATLYAPFAKHVFHDSVLGNLLDCAALFEAGGVSVLNTNDNTPDEAAAQRLRERHGRVTLAQLNYNAAGPFPSCFNNLDVEAKAAAHERVLRRNLNHGADVARILEPQMLMPFAGAYVIGGREWRKNAMLGTTSPDEAAACWREKLPDTPVLLLNEGQSIDLSTGERDGEYQPHDRSAELAYIEAELAPRSYPYEQDQALTADELGQLCRSARDRLWAKQQQFGIFPDLNVSIDLNGPHFQFSMASPDNSVREEAPPDPGISVHMDPRLLGRILDGRAHWNNAEIGCHIDFVRRPDAYLPDFHTLMAFFTA